jgi:hypothetical protein
VPVAALGSVLAAGAPAALVMLGVTALTRIMLHWQVRASGAPALHWLLLPLRDSLGLLLWCWGFVTRHVHWRQDRFRVQRDGSVACVCAAVAEPPAVPAPPVV